MGDTNVAHILHMDDDFTLMYQCQNTLLGHNGNPKIIAFLYFYVREIKCFLAGAFIFNRHRPIEAQKVKTNHENAIKILHDHGIKDVEPLVEVLQETSCDSHV